MPARLILFFAIAVAQGATQQEFFESRIRPILARNCFACHTSSKLGGLEMTTRESLLKGGNSGPAIVPGHADESLLIRAVRRQHERIQMPPQGRLSEEEINDLAEWIRQGAVWPLPAVPRTAAPGRASYTPEQKGFWSFLPIQKPALPRVKDASWVKTPVDRFVLAKLEERRLKPVKPASARTWIRRVTLDLTGLPPTVKDVDAFLNDKSSEARTRVVDRLLASPQYGERWGRHWLDVARYSDDHMNSTADQPYENAYRYRDWVIHAFNADMPYDSFVKAQLAGDFLQEKDKAALGFYALSPEFQDDRVDVTTRGFLGLTVACAQCHDHKFDPISTRDFYALQGVFSNTKVKEFPLVSDDEVKAYDRLKTVADERAAALDDFLKAQADSLAEVLAAQTPKYLVAACATIRNHPASAGELDSETLDRWVQYLRGTRNHPYLNDLDKLLKVPGSDQEIAEFAANFGHLVDKLLRDKKGIDERNFILLGGLKDRPVGDPRVSKLEALERERYMLWRDLFSAKGVLYYGPGKIDRFLGGQWKQHLAGLRAAAEAGKKAVPPKFAFLHVVGDVEKPANMRIQIGGNRNNLGDEAPRAFLSILCDGTPKPFHRGSGRLDLAEAITDARNPLTARVMANRVWLWHFGAGIVGTPDNFGVMGERPDNPALLDYLAARFIESGWSMKALHREILLSAVYGLSTADDPGNKATDDGNRFFWRANRTRLEAEALRDSILFVSGKLDAAVGGPPVKLAETNRRTVYSFVSRRQTDPALTIFDFPNPNSTLGQRLSTDIPMQRLFLLNSPLVIGAAEAMAKSVRDIPQAYAVLFSRLPTRAELDLGAAYLKRAENSWPQYLQVLMSSDEFLFMP